MRIWRSKPRFFYPRCRHLISIAIGSDYDPDTNWFRVFGVCPDGLRKYRKEAWRKLPGPFLPRTDVSPGPASSAGEQ